MKCEICEKREAEYRHKLGDGSFCKKCLYEEFGNMSFNDYIEELFIEEQEK